MFFKKVLRLSSILLLAALVSSAQSSLPLKYKRSSLFAGIEVGSKGVKMSLVELSKNSGDNEDLHVLKDTSVNTDFISFTRPTFDATLNAFAGLYDAALSNYKISPDKIFTVVSSGVKVTADRENKAGMINELIDSFKIRTHTPAQNVQVISTEEEARLSHLGIVPESKRFTTFLIDIGSGNTKGGYFPNGNLESIKLFGLTWGTKSIANATEKRLDNDPSMANYYKQLQRVLAGDANNEIVYAVNVSGAYNMSDNIAFSGGAAWATATLLFPEMLDNPVVPVTYEEVEKFNEKLENDYTSFSSKNILQSLPANTSDKEDIAKAVNTVNKVFDQKAMMAGAGLLLRIMRQFEGVYEKKQFYLVKNGQVGWISAYVNRNSPK